MTTPRLTSLVSHLAERATSATQTVDGAPEKEYMVITLWDPEPKDVLDELKKRFPYIDVTYFRLKSASKPSALEDKALKGLSSNILSPLFVVFL
jgi:hypothetical protein